MITTDNTSQPGTLPIVRVGMLRLSDAAPLVMALEKGFFAAKGVDVQVFVEPSWANIADKLTFGHLDAAIMLPPLALAMALGLRGMPSSVIVPMGLSLNGNSITVSHRIADAVDAGGKADAMETGRRFCTWLRRQTRKPRLAVVHTFSTHNLLLRYWLAATGIDPDRDVDITILPPSETADALKMRDIDGFCAGAPWGSVAVANGAGRTILVSSEIWRNHPEKCLAVGRIAEQRPQLLAPLLGALLESARYCDEPKNAAEIAAILGQPQYLNVDPVFVQASLPCAPQDTPVSDGDVDRSIFSAHAANIPFRSHAVWFLSQMTRWNYLPRTADAAALAETVYRPELLQSLTGLSSAREPERFCDSQP
ncbi:MAG: CmpA/NrtA family ABC transporter substrate-binding protein [Rhizomicrobium sp.]